MYINSNNILKKTTSLVLKQLVLTLFVLLNLFLVNPVFSQCGTPGQDGPTTGVAPVNSYFPINTNITLSPGDTFVVVGAVPAVDVYGNSFGATLISPGDLVLIIQMQDASINYTNTSSYGAGSSSSGPDALGGTGYTALGNSGLYEFVIAKNSVPLTGGTLIFEGKGTSGGSVINIEMQMQLLLKVIEHFK